MPQHQERQAYAVRAMLALWICTIVAYGLHEQKSIAWFDLFPAWKKWHWVVPNLAVIAWAWARPSSRPALLTVTAFSAISLPAMHSWLGALPPWLPVALTGFAFFRGCPAEDWKRAAWDSLLLGMALTAAHRLNFDYLAGYEFSDGLFARIFPEGARAWTSSRAAFCAWAWMISIAFTLVLLLLRFYRAALLVAAVQALVNWYLYHVIFYDFYLVVPLWLAFDQAPLRRWNYSVLQRCLPRPWFVYLATMALFFLRYLYLRPQMGWYWPIIFAGILSVALSSRLSSMAEIKAAARTRRHHAWNLLLAAYLLVPWVLPAVPAPFSGTYFSAREARHPPLKAQLWPKRDGNCDWIFSEYATRWGYLVKSTDDGCRVSVYR